MKHKYMIFLFILSLGSVLGSLYTGYFGNILQNLVTGEMFNSSNAIQPCELCRYMRVFQYPILIISGVSLRKKHYKYAVSYIYPLAIIGTIISVYKYFLEIGIIEKSTSGICVGSIPCDVGVTLGNEYITLSLLGLIIFLITLRCCGMIETSDKKHKETEENALKDDLGNE